jgi:hypothetical protein
MVNTNYSKMNVQSQTKITNYGLTRGLGGRGDVGYGYLLFDFAIDYCYGYWVLLSII